METGYPLGLVLYVQAEWGECGSLILALFSGYGTLVFGVWYVWDAVGYAQNSVGSFRCLAGEDGATWFYSCVEDSFPLFGLVFVATVECSAFRGF